jgi:hypothetical protein
MSSILSEMMAHKSVAIVGNALSLYSQKFGDEIDSHDVVIRINKPGNIIYKDESELESTGRKIDCWVVWNSRIFHDKVLLDENVDIRLKHNFLYNTNIVKAEAKISLEPMDEILQLYTKENGLLNDLHKKIDDYSVHRRKVEEFLRSRRRLINNIMLDKAIRARLPKRRNLSTGVLVLNYVIKQNPRNINIYGMDFKRTPTFYDVESHEKNMRNTRYDYLCGHDYDFEEKFVKDVILKNASINIQFRGS